jgi:phosphoribosylanthranilate isomerase
MKIKVCGVTQIEQLKQLDELGIDYAGMIFYQQSARYMMDKLKSTEVSNLPLSLKKVGVFVNASVENIQTQVELYGLDLVQLHGDETPAFCKFISQFVSVIKAFRITKYNEENIDWMIKPYDEFCDYYLFDTNRKGAYGGTGEKFDWKILNSNKINKLFFLSGGIGPADAEKVNSFHHPFFYAVDVNSKVETAEGIKDIAAIQKLIGELEK